MMLKLVTPPSDPLVTADDLRAHLHVDGSDQDAMIDVYRAAALAMLDGWRGIMGRAIMPQTWSQEFDSWGDLRLAMPDVSAVRVAGFDADGGDVAATSADLIADQRGSYVAASGRAVSRVVVEFDCGLPAASLPSVRVAVMMLVANWFTNREATIAGSVSVLPFAVDCLIDPLIWRQP